MSEPLMLALEGLLLVFLICLSAFFSSSEIALFSLSRAKLLAYKDDPSTARRRIHDLMSDYHGTLICIILANMFVNSLLSMLNEELLSSLHLSPLTTSLLSAFVGIVVLLIFGEITPMTLAYRYSDEWSEKASGPIWFLRKATFPVVSVVELVCNKILDLLGRRKTKPLDQAEYLSYLETCLDHGAFPIWEANLLRGAFSLRDKTVLEIMHARVNLGFIKFGENPGRVAEIIMESKSSHIIVGGGDIDDADMILSSRAFFLLSKEERSSWWTSSCVSRAVFIPSGCSLMKAFRTLRQKSASAAIVTDEYGGLAGLLARQDIYSELIGRAGEGEDGVPSWKAFKAGFGRWVFEGRCPLSLVEECTGWKAPSGCEANTIGGLLSELLGVLPGKGSTAEANGAKLTASALDGQRVSEIVLTLEEGQGRGR